MVLLCLLGESLKVLHYLLQNFFFHVLLLIQNLQPLACLDQYKKALQELMLEGLYRSLLCQDYIIKIVKEDIPRRVNFHQ